MSTLKVEKIQHPNSASVALTLDTSGYLALQAGSASTPAIQGPSDPNTGIFFPAADTIAFAEGGTEVLRIDSNGRVGIGTTSAIGLLQIKYASNVNTSFRNSSAAGLTAGTLVEAVNDGFSAFTPYYVRASEYGFGTDSGGTYIPRFTIDSSGRVGVGTTSPSAKLAVVYSTNGIELDPQFGFVSGTVRAYDRTTSSYKTLGLTGDSVVFGISDIEKARIDSSGRLLVGTSSASSTDNDANFPYFQLEGVIGDPSRAMLRCNGGTDQFGGPILYLSRSRGTTSNSKTSVANDDMLGEVLFLGADGADDRRAASIRAFVDGTPGANDMPGRIVLSTTPDGASSPTEYMRIDNLGTKFNYGTDNHVFFSNTSKGSNTSDSIFYGRYSATGTTNGTICVIIRSNGQIENVNGVYGTFSDIKLKENVVDAHSQWDDIKNLRIVNYNYKPETNYDQHTQLGVIAQEVELFSPGLISESTDYDEDGNDIGSTTKSVKYSVLYMKAVKALQEAMERIEQLEAEMAEVKAQLS